MPKHRISIITVTYNDPRGLSATLRSLEPVQAAGLDWEHVVVDSSPALNAEAIASARAGGWPLRYLTPPPEGIYAAQNHGLAQASGECLWFLNGGDRLHDVHALVAVLEQLGSDAALDFVVARAALERDGKFLYRHDPSDSFFAGLVGFNRMCHQAMVYHARVFEQLGPFPPGYRLAADYVHHLRAYTHGLRFKTVGATLVAFDMGGRSNDHAPVFEEFKRAHRELASELPAWFSAANELVRPLERARVGGLKLVARSPLAELLRPLWVGFKRLQRRG